MPAPVNREEFFDLVRRSGVLEADRLDTFASSVSDSGNAPEHPQVVALDVRQLAGTAGLGHGHINAARGKFHR